MLATITETPRSKLTFKSTISVSQPTIYGGNSLRLTTGEDTVLVARRIAHTLHFVRADDTVLIARRIVQALKYIRADYTVLVVRRIVLIVDTPKLTRADSRSIDSCTYIFPVVAPSPEAPHDGV